MIGIESRDAEPLPSEQGTIEKGLIFLTRKPRPESGQNAFNCAEFSRQRNARAVIKFLKD